MFWSQCTSCGHRFRVADENAGLELPCPKCKVRLVCKPGSATDVTPPQTPPDGGPLHVQHAPQDVHAPVDLGPATTPVPRRKTHRFRNAWMAIVTLVLVAGAGYAVHLAMKNDLPNQLRRQLSEGEPQTPTTQKNADFPPADVPMTAASGQPTSTVPAEALLIPPMGEWVRPGQLTGWDSFNGLAWGTQISQIDGLKPAGDKGTIFEPDITWYTRGDEAENVAGASVEAVYYAFLKGRFCDVMLLSRQPDAVRTWLEQRYGPSNAESHRDGVLCWRGKTSAGYDVVIEYAARPGALPCTLRMTIEGIR